MTWGNGQFYMAPRVDHIHDQGVDHWVALGKAHGFAGPHIQLAGMPLQNQGVRALVSRSTFSWLWVWPDSNWVPPGSIGIPRGGLMGDEAKRYYDEVASILTPAVSGQYGISVGSDPFEWVGGGDVGQARDDIAEWAEYMTGLLGFTSGGLLIGARSSTRARLPGTYAGWGHHFNNKPSVGAQIISLDALSGGLPNFAGEDRLRERDPLRDKDFTQRQQLKAMREFIEQGAGAIWGVLGVENDGRHETGTLAWDDPGAVKAILEGDAAPPPPPGGSRCDDVALYLNAEMARHGQEVRSIEAMIRGLCDSTPPPSPPGGNDLEGIMVIGVAEGWHIPDYGTTCIISTVELDGELTARWPDQGWPEADIGPFPPSNPHHGRMYLVNFRTRRMWGVEWTRRPGEAAGTTVYPWDEDGLNIVETLIRKAKSDSDLAEILAGDPLGVVIAAPHLRERSSVLKFRT